MGVREQLASLGTDLGQFSQSTFRGDITGFGDTDLTGGYCAGVCLDWARRVLLSESDRDLSFLTYSGPKYASETTKTETLSRMAGAYKGQSGSYVATSRQSEAIAKLTPLLSAPEGSWTIDDKRVTGVGVPNATAQLITKVLTFKDNDNPFRMNKEPAAVVSRASIQRWLDIMREGDDPQHTPLAGGGREWGQYANELDAQFSNRSKKKKKFGNLSVVASSPQQTYQSPRVWRGELMSEGFRENCCTIIGVGAPGDTGHAVAVHLLGGAYRFFDPNYGVFKFSKESLRDTFQYLFGAPLFEGEEGEDTDLPVYRRRTTTSPRGEKEWTRMSYTIFKKSV